MDTSKTIEDIDNSGHLWRKPYCCCCMQLQLLPFTKVKNGSLSVFHFTFVALRSPAKPLCISWLLFVNPPLLKMMFAKGEAATVAPIREWGSCKIGMSDRREECYRTKHMSIRRTSISACRVSGVQGIQIGCVVSTAKESSLLPLLTWCLHQWAPIFLP